MNSGHQFIQYLSIETAGGATWHPSGKKIAFVSNTTGEYQVYSCEISRGVTHDRKQLTSAPDRCTDPRYLPDGTLVFTRDFGGDENFQIGIIDEKNDLHWLTDALDVKHRIGHISEEHLYLFLKQANIRPFVTGAVQPKLNQKNMKAIPFLKASRELNERFAEIVQPFFRRIRANTDESENLAQIRDALLPKLFSGETRIKDAAKRVKALI